MARTMYIQRSSHDDDPDEKPKAQKLRSLCMAVNLMPDEVTAVVEHEHDQYEISIQDLNQARSIRSRNDKRVSSIGWYLYLTFFVAENARDLYTQKIIDLHKFTHEEETMTVKLATPTTEQQEQLKKHRESFYYETTIVDLDTGTHTHEFTQELGTILRDSKKRIEDGENVQIEIVFIPESNRLIWSSANSDKPIDGVFKDIIHLEKTIKKAATTIKMGNAEAAMEQLKKDVALVS